MILRITWQSLQTIRHDAGAAGGTSTSTTTEPAAA